MGYRIVFDVIWFAECRSGGNCVTASTLELLLNKVNLL